MSSLGDFLTLQRGFDITKKEQTCGIYPVVSSSGVNSFHNQFKVEGPGVVIGRKGTLGTCFYIPENFWPHDTSLWVKDFKGNNPKFVYYYLKSLPLDKLDSGSANPTLNRNVVHQIESEFPKRDNQNKIADILFSIDSKIELNNKINSELESMAKLIYDYWFVQFNFPDKNGKPYKSSGGKLVYNQELKREIPKGWDYLPLIDWINNDKSGDWGKDSEQGNYTIKVKCIRGADINGLNGKGIIKSPTRFILKKNEYKILEKGDLIVEISGGSPTQSTGRLAIITEGTLERFKEPLICSNFCKAVTLKENEALFNFKYLWNRLYDAGVLFCWEGKTSGIKNLLFDSFVRKYKTPKPPKDLMKLFYNNIKPLDSQIQKTLIQNQRLTELRDWLLPMLMNGQVSVEEAEKKVSEYMAAESTVGYGV